MIFSASKPTIVFYEKPGCAGNARQKKLLKQCGYELDVKDILSNPWTTEELQSFFYGLDKTEIVNESAPDIKNGILKLEKITKDDLIFKMLETPILIKRPLMIFGENKLCGFNTSRLSKVLNVDINMLQEISTCTSEDSCKSV
ncbi:ArsC/Spx/MgsR family protein [Sulfurimonas sp.]|uniref:ArsC/Spx/MgsR family protein n=1 Tax=Sulfurimonas sp. TaxID=2022749 RepID=UPI0035694174